MKKVVVKLDLHDDKEKKKALKEVSTLHGIDSIAMDMKEQKLTVIGSVDPVDVVGKLRKLWHTEIVSVGPPKEPEKKDGGGDKKDGGDNKDGGDKKVDVNKQIAELVEAYKAYNPRLTTHYAVHSVEEDPNSCVIC